MRVLFFGSDTFSVRALNVLKKQPGITTDIVTPEIKKYGRKLDKLAIPSIQTYCEHYNLPFVTQVNGFIRNKINNFDYDACIVVSYDSFIPIDILSKIPWSLNIHPSLLPKYKGSSPLQYTLLNRDIDCGVTLQKLDPHNFDAGNIIAQTASLQVVDVLGGELKEVPYVYDNSLHKCSLQRQDQDLEFLSNSTENRIYGDKFNSFKNEMGNIGASLFHEYLNKEMYKTTNFVSSQHKKSWAKKLNKNVKKIDWNTYGRSKILNNFHVLKNLYTFKKQFVKDKNQAEGRYQLKRVILSDLEEFDNDSLVPEVLKASTPGGFASFIDDKDHGKAKVLIKCCDGKYLMCNELQFESFQVEDGAKWLRNLSKRCNNKHASELNHNACFE